MWIWGRRLPVRMAEGLGLCTWEEQPVGDSYTMLTWLWPLYVICSFVQHIQYVHAQGYNLICVYRLIHSGFFLQPWSQGTPLVSTDIGISSTYVIFADCVPMFCWVSRWEQTQKEYWKEMNICWVFTLYHLVYFSENRKYCLSHFHMGIWDSLRLTYLPNTIKLTSSGPGCEHKLIWLQNACSLY